MASLTLKNIPESLLERLRGLAREERRSLSQQALHLIEGGLPPRVDEAAAATPEVLAQVKRWRALAGRWQSSMSLEEEVASIHAARTPGRAADL